MNASTAKKVVLHRFDRQPVAGYVDPRTWLQEAMVEVLTPGGALEMVPFGEIKWVAFVRDFDGPTPDQERRKYQSRPKQEGLWVRAQLRDLDFLEGVMANDLLQTGSLGFFLTPPDAAGNNQRLWIPRVSLKQFLVLGVTGAEKKRRGEEEGRQIGLFEG